MSGEMEIGTAWVCHACDVGGVDLDLSPSCWNCDGPTTVTARPAIHVLRAAVDAGDWLPWATG